MIQLDLLVTKMAGFEASYPVTGQTYPRLIDATIVSALATFGSAAHKVNYLYNHYNIFEMLYNSMLH